MMPVSAADRSDGEIDSRPHLATPAGKCPSPRLLLAERRPFSALPQRAPPIRRRRSAAGNRCDRMKNGSPLRGLGQESLMPRRAVVIWRRAGKSPATEIVSADRCRDCSAPRTRRPSVRTLPAPALPARRSALGQSALGQSARGGRLTERFAMIPCHGDSASGVITEECGKISWQRSCHRSASHAPRRRIPGDPRPGRYNAVSRGAPADAPVRLDFPRPWLAIPDA